MEYENLSNLSSCRFWGVCVCVCVCVCVFVCVYLCLYSVKISLYRLFLFSLNTQIKFIFKEFFSCGPFYQICYSIVSGLFVCLFSFCDHKACGILASQPGTEPAAPVLEGKALTTRLPWKSQ